MKKAFILLALFILIGNVSATSLYWSDVFPACMGENSNTDLKLNLRCGADFVVPNMHLQALFNLFVSSLKSLFLIDSIPGTINGISSFFSGFGIDSAFNIRLPKIDLNLGGIIDGIISALVNWIIGVLSPWLIMGLILLIEFVKTYLMLCLPMSVLIAIAKELNMVSDAPTWPLLLAGITIIILIAGSVGLLMFDLSHDLGLLRF